MVNIYSLYVKPLKFIVNREREELFVPVISVFIHIYTIKILKKLISLPTNLKLTLKIN